MLSRILFRVLLVIVLGLVAFVSIMVFLKARHVVYTIAIAIGFEVAAAVLFTLAVVVGASSVGAEWATGSMSTLLTWEPRRLRVLVAKIVAAVVTVTIVSLFVLVFLALTLLPSAVAHGNLHGVPWWTVAGVWVRIGAVAAVGVTLGIGLASVLRNAAGSVATWLIFQFVASPALLVWKRWLIRWLPDGIIRQFVALEGIVRASFGSTPDFVSFGGNVLRGGLLLAAYAGALVAAGYYSFRARDVT